MARGSDAEENGRRGHGNDHFGIPWVYGRRRRRADGFFAEILAFWLAFVARAFDPYRPELYYMRGPGPACRAKQAAARQRIA